MNRLARDEYRQQLLVLHQPLGHRSRMAIAGAPGRTGTGSRDNRRPWTGRLDRGKLTIVVEIASGLRGAAEDAVKLFANAPKFEVRVEERLAFEMIFPLAAHAIEQVRAALMLIDAGLAYAAEANARSALEHAVTAQWVLLTEGSEEHLEAAMRRHLRAEILDMSELVDLPEELLVAAGEQVNSSGPARNFWEMCDRFSTDKSLYLLYRRLTNSVHASMRTYAEHLMIDKARSDVIIGVRKTSSHEPEPELLAGLAFSAMFALSAVESFRSGRTRMAAVQEAGDKWQISVGLAADDSHPELQRKPV